MNDCTEPPQATEFTTDWTAFEKRLARLLASFAAPTLHDTIRLRYPSPGGALCEVTIEGGFTENCVEGEFSTIVRMLLPGQEIRTYSFAEDAPEAPEALDNAAREVCLFLRESALIAHPSLLTAEADSGRPLPELELPDAAGIVREVDDRLGRPARRLANRGDDGPTPLIRSDHGSTDDLPEGALALGVKELREAVEVVLESKYGTVDLDSDGDYRIHHPFIGGTRFYVSVPDEQPVIRIWKTVVYGVNSRRAATIEANYLNRVHPFTKWVLWGHNLSQEVYIPCAPFVPHLLEEMLDRFGEQYAENVSALQLRLGGNE